MLTDPMDRLRPLYRSPIQELRAPHLCSAGRGRQHGQGEAQSLAKVDSGIVGGESVGLSPQVQGVAGAAALETVEVLLFQVDAETAAGGGRRAVQRTGASLLAAARAVGLEAEQW